MFLLQPKITSDYQCEKREKKDWKGHLLCILEAGGEGDMGPHKRVIMDWTRKIKSGPQVTIRWWMFRIMYGSFVSLELVCD